MTPAAIERASAAHQVAVQRVTAAYSEFAQRHCDRLLDDEHDEGIYRASARALDEATRDANIAAQILKTLTQQRKEETDR